MSAISDRNVPSGLPPSDRSRPHAPRQGRRLAFTIDRILSVLIVLPSILAISIFVYGFIAWSVRVSLSAWTKGLIPNYTYSGLTRYIELLSDRRFGIDMRNTAIFTSLFLVVCLIVGLLLAILLDQRLKGEGFFRSIFLFPMALSFIVTGVAWRWLMNPATGTRISGLNLLFDQLGLDFLISRWHTTPPPWGIAFVVIPAVWQMSGFTMAMYLAGLRGISDDLREAARVDGANEFQLYRYIILPQLQSVTLSAVIVLGHTSLKIFDLIVAISQNDIKLDVPAVYMWRTTFDGSNYSRGAAIGIVMLITVAVLIVPYLISSMRSQEAKL
ncbi:MAG: sugar ABC transporter permease [Anaerolineae bacterium]|nr:sugar ABC transporter permease [Anaerolineae bacterium]